MQQRTRGWIMPEEADILLLLRLIGERINPPKIEVRHRDTLIRHGDMLEDELNCDRHHRLPVEQETH